MPNASEPGRNDAAAPCREARRSADVDIRVESSGLAVREALQQLGDGLERFDLGPEEAGTVQLVMAEILNNIVEHAYPPRGPVGPIHIRGNMASDGLHLEISDRGRPMPEGKLPIGRRQPVDVALPELPEGGFGWFLIQDLARDLRYLRRGAENRLSLRIAVGLRKLN